MKYKELGKMLSKAEMKNVKGGNIPNPCTVCGGPGTMYYCSGGRTNFYTCDPQYFGAEGCHYVGSCNIEA